MGQTVRTIHQRAYDHWTSRFRNADLFHQSLALDADPFGFIALPLEFISRERYYKKGMQRKNEVTKFRVVATPRERYWVGRVNSMWPYGWNSMVPGKPVSSSYQRRRSAVPSSQGQPPTDSTGLPEALDPVHWLAQWKADSLASVKEVTRRGKFAIYELLHHLQTAFTPAQINNDGLSPVVQLIEALRAMRTAPPKRQFLKVKYTNNAARDFQLRTILRRPEVYECHPEPEDAAGIMLVESFSPQIQALLFNYSQAAVELDAARALEDNLSNCACGKCFRQMLPDDIGPSGHVCTYNTQRLKWGYLADDVREQKLRQWAAAVMKFALANWKAAEAKRGSKDMDGFPGLRQAIAEARTHLVFLHDDRAHPEIFIVCKRWYQKEMAKYLADGSVFDDVSGSWEELISGTTGLKTTLQNVFGFRCGEGIVYNYGIWKPTKGKFRFIAGTRTSSASESGTSAPEARMDCSGKKGPPRSPTYFMCKALVKMLNVAIHTLRELDETRHAETGLKCFWGIDSVNAFTRMVRANADMVVRHGLSTYDFTTMYTSFSQATLIRNAMVSLTEAFEYEASKAPPGQGAPTLTENGWSWGGDGLDLRKLREMVGYSILTNYTFNGGKIRRQVKGLPMGIPHAPQLVNLACYPVEKEYVLRTRPMGLACRYIDDFATSGMDPPPMELYSMEYKKTSVDPNHVIFLGVEVAVREGRVHTTLHDREDEYPFHIVRYPAWDTVAPQQQFGGVVMGRFVSAQEACSYLQDFKESVANVVRRALQRKYPKNLLSKVWARFLHTRWPAGDIRRKELLNWFRRLMVYLDNHGETVSPKPGQRLLPVRPAQLNSAFLQVFGQAFEPGSQTLAYRRQRPLQTALREQSCPEPPRAGRSGQAVIVADVADEPDPLITNTGPPEDASLSVVVQLCGAPPTALVAAALDADSPSSPEPQRETSEDSHPMDISPPELSQCIPAPRPLPPLPQGMGDEMSLDVPQEMPPPPQLSGAVLEAVVERAAVLINAQSSSQAGGVPRAVQIALLAERRRLRVTLTGEQAFRSFGGSEAPAPEGMDPCGDRAPEGVTTYPQLYQGPPIFSGGILPGGVEVEQPTRSLEVLLAALGDVEHCEMHPPPSDAVPALEAPAQVILLGPPPTDSSYEPRTCESQAAPLLQPTESPPALSVLYARTSEAGEDSGRPLEDADEESQQLCGPLGEAEQGSQQPHESTTTSDTQHETVSYHADSQPTSTPSQRHGRKRSSSARWYNPRRKRPHVSWNPAGENSAPLLTTFSSAGWKGKYTLWQRITHEERVVLFRASSYSLRQQLLGWTTKQDTSEFKQLRSLLYAPVLTNLFGPQPGTASSSTSSAPAAPYLPGMGDLHEGNNPEEAKTPGARRAAYVAGVSAPPPDLEPVSHNAQEGKRIGEADNPGPPKGKVQSHPQPRQTANFPLPSSSRNQDHSGARRANQPAPRGEARQANPRPSAPDRRGNYFVTNNHTRDARQRPSQDAARGPTPVQTCHRALAHPRSDRRYDGPFGALNSPGSARWAPMFNGHQLQSHGVSYRDAAVCRGGYPYIHIPHVPECPCLWSCPRCGFSTNENEAPPSTAPFYPQPAARRSSFQAPPSATDPRRQLEVWQTAPRQPQRHFRGPFQGSNFNAGPGRDRERAREREGRFAALLPRTQRPMPPASRTQRQPPRPHQVVAPAPAPARDLARGARNARPHVPPSFTGVTCSPPSARGVNRGRVQQHQNQSRQQTPAGPAPAQPRKPASTTPNQEREIVSERETEREK